MFQKRFGEADFSLLSSASLLTQERSKSQEDALVFCFSRELVKT